jgi:hypothetical protein
MQRYNAMGGVAGALARQADRALATRQAAGRGPDEVLASLLRLVAIDRDGRPAEGISTAATSLWRSLPTCVHS